MGQNACGRTRWNASKLLSQDVVDLKPTVPVAILQTTQPFRTAPQPSQIIPKLLFQKICAIPDLAKRKICGKPVRP